MKCGYNVACFVEVGICFVILLFTVYLQSTRRLLTTFFYVISALGVIINSLRKACMQTCLSVIPVGRSFSRGYNVWKYV